MKRTLIPLLALLAAGPPGGFARMSYCEVTAVRYWPLSEVTRVVIEVSGEFEFHAERAHNPERIFFDVKGIRGRISRVAVSIPRTVDDKLVKKVRVAETQTGVTRVVLDLQSNADYSATQLSNPGPAGGGTAAKGTAALPMVLPHVRPGGHAIFAGPPGLGVLAGARRRHRLPAPLPRRSRRPPPRPQPERSQIRAAPKSQPPERIESGRAAKLASDGSGSLTRALGLKIRRVVLDPGHGGP